jgi:hypothetical protein
MSEIITVPEPVETVRAYEKQTGTIVPSYQRRNPYASTFYRGEEAERQREGEIVPPSSSAYYSVPMPALGKPPSILPYVALGGIVASGLFVLIIKYRPNWILALASRLGITSLETTVVQSTKVRSAIERSKAQAAAQARKQALEENGIFTFSQSGGGGGGGGPGIRYDDREINFVGSSS